MTKNIKYPVSVLKSDLSFAGIIRALIILNSLVILSSCTEEYWPDLGEKYYELLVVEGMVTNAPGPYTVKLTQSTSIRYPREIPLTGYEVIISDNAGNSETLAETEEGTYMTAPNGIQGVVGRSYKLSIHAPTGTTYESGFEELTPPVAIDTLYPVVEFSENENFSIGIPGYRFYISSKQGNSDTTYLRWQLDQTYKYAADFLIFYYYDGVLHEFPDPDSLQVCWITSPVYSIYTATTAGTLSQQVTDFPLHYVSFASRLLSIRYSLLIKQMNLSKSAYDYWKAVNEQNTSGDQLFTKLPYQIQGNMHNTSDENEPVLGFFQVCGIDIKRVYFNRPPPPYEMYYAICQLTQPDYEEYGWMFKTNDWREWPRYVTVDGSGARAVPNVMCIDCRETGGTIDKPEFWTD